MAKKQKEDKYSKEQINRIISKIKSEQKQREARIKQKLEKVSARKEGLYEGIKSSQKRLKYLKRKGLSPGKSKKLERKISSQQRKLREQRKKEKIQKIKTGLLIGASKVESRTERALENIYQKLGKYAQEKVTSRRVLKKTRNTIKIPEYKAPSVLGDENRFFKNEMEEAKKSLFFS